MNAEQIEQQFALDLYPRRGITLVRGEGALLWDDTGKQYIDCTAGIGVANIGHAHPALTAAITNQAATLSVCPGVFYNDVRARLMQRLAELSPASLKRVFLCNSGTEATEAAIKFARAATGKAGIVSAMRGFHGRTLGALSATFKYRDAFEPLLPHCTFVPLNNINKLESAVGGQTAAVMLEPVQGEGGVRRTDPEFLQAARQICSDHNALLIIDEVQTGCCRTGSFFACDALGLEPDMITMAKGLAGGMPIGAVLCSDQVQVKPGIHGSTFGGNPLACAASLATIDVMIDEGLAERAAQLGQRWYQRFTAHSLPRVREVRQYGLMIGVELKEKATPFLKLLAERGVLALPAGPTVIRLLPPLVISEAQIDAVADAMVNVLGTTE